MGRFNLCFRPHKKGLEKILGELETKVMEVVWRRDEVTVREVFEEFSEKRHLAYTTVLSTMSNLYRKGFLERTKSGTAYLYRPAYTRLELANLAVNEVVKGLLDSFGQPFMACLTDLSKKKDIAGAVEHLEKLLEEQGRGE